MSSDVLFTPFEFKSLKLPNRVVMAPMTRSFSPGGVATDDVAAYYRRRAEKPVGLLVPASRREPGRADRHRGHGRGPAGLAERRQHSAVPRREGASGLERGGGRGP